MRGKGRVEFVDEFRKIKTLQKLNPLETTFQDNPDSVKVQNNKFIRYREENKEIQEYMQSRRDDVLLENMIIQDYKKDVELQCFANHDQCREELFGKLEYFKGWSNGMNEEIRNKDYKFLFRFQQAVPPARIGDQQTDHHELKTLFADRGNKKTEEQNSKGEEESLRSNRNKYDFQAISEAMQKQRDGNKNQQSNLSFNESTVKQELDYFKNYRTIEDIDNLGDFKEQFQKFNYSIESNQQHRIQFVDNSIIRDSSILDIDYFRDLGPPSRDIDQYVNFKRENEQSAKPKDRMGKRNKGKSRERDKVNKDREKSKQKENDEEERGKEKGKGKEKDKDKTPKTPGRSPRKDDDYDKEQSEILRLYFLKAEELNVDKARIDFFNISNITMGRVTSLNASMCIRSDKKDRKDIANLIKKLEKFNIKDSDENKGRVHRADGPDQLEDDQQLKKNGLQDSASDLDLKDVQKATNLKNLQQIELIIEDINCIRRQYAVLVDNTTKNSFNRDALSIEVYSKLEERLKALHEIVLGGANMQYRLEDIAEHLQELQGDSQYGYDQLKVLWFIASIYDEILHKKKKVNDISSLLKSGSSIEPRIISYKKKGGSQVAITRKVFGFPNEKTTRKNISQNQVSSKSPIKQKLKPSSEKVKDKSKSPLRTPARAKSPSQDAQSKRRLSPAVNQTARNRQVHATASKASNPTTVRK